MKIDQDLRIAIRAAEKIQPANTKHFDERNAIECFLKRSPKARAALKRATALSERGKACYAQARDIMAEFGLDDDASFISNHEKFAAVGGMAKPQAGKPWRAEHVIGRLVVAKPEQRAAILAEYGINWS